MHNRVLTSFRLDIICAYSEARLDRCIHEVAERRLYES